MVAMVKSETSSPTNPRLTFANQVDGHLLDVAELKFEVFDRRRGDQQLNPVLVSGPTTVDLVADRLGAGRYVASFTAPDSIGMHRVRWSWRRQLGGQLYVAEQDFEVLTVRVSEGPMYGFVAEIVGAGYEGDEISIQTGILVASQLIEKITGRFFEPRFATFKVDGKNSRIQMLGHPIIGIETIGIEAELFEETSTEVELSDTRVYNRHLSQRLTNPDDRNNPRIEFVLPYNTSARRFPDGAQQVLVTGLFGYTDWDGTPTGGTPLLIKHVARQIALREIPGLSSACQGDLQYDWRVVEERTRDQTVKYSSPTKWGQWTGDPTVDQILLMFMRPPTLGAA